MMLKHCIQLISLLFNKSNEQKSGNILIKKNAVISVAESCTGGLLSSLLTDVPGSSSYIKANFVTYANEAKMKYLGVKAETLKNFGAVSKQTAAEMAEGLITHTILHITC